MDALDIRVLRHIGRYTITLRRVLEVLFFDGGSPQATLTKLERLGYITCAERALPGNFSYYQLTRRGCAVLGDVSVNQAKPRNPQRFDTELGALWFSCMSEKPRKRLTTAELRTLFGPPKGANIIFVAEADEEQPTAYRLFVPEFGCNLGRLVTKIKKTAHECCADPSLVRWIERGTYQFAVLLTDENRLAQLAELIRNEDFPDLRIHLSIAPSRRDLSLFIGPERDS